MQVLEAEEEARTIHLRHINTENNMEIVATQDHVAVISSVVNRGLNDLIAGLQPMVNSFTEAYKGMVPQDKHLLPTCPPLNGAAHNDVRV